MTQNNQLQPGAYPLPPNCKAFVRDGKVIVSVKKRASAQYDSCRDCKYFGYGYVTRGSYHQTTVCRARPKSVEYMSERLREAGVYYAAHPQSPACEKFEPITPPKP